VFNFITTKSQMQMYKQILLTLFLFFTTFVVVQAQRTIEGRVTAKDEGALAGATIQAKGTSIGTVTDLDGKYTLRVPEGSTILLFSFVGYGSKEVVLGESNEVNVELEESTLLDEVVVLGSRGSGRTKLETVAPVDILNIGDIATQGPQTTVNAILNYVAPSFSSNTQTISDGTDHIDPASLRALGPDQVLVLINGKRRHTTSLVNVNGTFGRGNVGTDMNAIPVAAIEKIEVLRDGAAAQYGSDAIAGVINIILKKKQGLSVNAGTGAYFSSEIPDADGSVDGENLQFNVNYGMPLGEKGGFLNLTGAFDDRQHTNRMKEFTGKIFAGYNNPNHVGDPNEDITNQELLARGLERSDFNMRVGQSALRNASFMGNLELPLSEKTTLYAFGGLNYRRGQATGFYRLPHQERTVTDIYPNGFLPEINTNILDKSLAFGVRHTVNKWDIDLSNVYGYNSFDYFISNSNNASLGAASPTSFNSGGFSFTQNTTNFDVRRYFPEKLKGLNVAFGAEYRFENYQITAGEEASYTNYGLASWYTTTRGDSILIQDNSGPINTVFGPNGSARPGGAQVFPGFRPDNELSKFRSSVALYADVEADFTDDLLVGIAGRFEDYSDFGSTFNGKLSARYKLGENWAVRAAASTGFRAPSLHQLNFNSTATLFVDGIPYEVGTFSNDSRVAKLLGIEQLKQETSRSFSAGITGQIPDANLSITIDGYLVEIDDRIVLTGTFRGDANGSAQDQEIYQLLREANASQATFFANAIDTRTSGVDIVITHKAEFGKSKLKTSLAGTMSNPELLQVNTSDVLEGKEDTYFDRTSQIYLTNSVPTEKFNLTFDYSIGNFSAMLRNVYFGAVEEATNSETNTQEFAGKVITDLSLSYSFNKKFSLTVGANNLLDIYPDENREENLSSGRFLYSRRSQQFGFNGRYLFGRLSFEL